MQRPVRPVIEGEPCPGILLISLDFTAEGPILNKGRIDNSLSLLGKT